MNKPFSSYFYKIHGFFEKMDSFLFDFIVVKSRYQMDPFLPPPQKPVFSKLPVLFILAYLLIHLDTFPDDVRNEEEYKKIIKEGTSSLQEIKLKYLLVLMLDKKLEEILWTDLNGIDRQKLRFINAYFDELAVNKYKEALTEQELHFDEAVIIEETPKLIRETDIRTVYTRSQITLLPNGMFVSCVSPRPEKTIVFSSACDEFIV